MTYRGGRRAAILLTAIFVCLTGTLSAERATLPVAASLVGQGGAPFVSDVRVFNTSYTQTLSVTATYRPAANAPAPQVFQLAPREGRAFDDMVGQFFARPGTLGAVEFEYSGSGGALVAVSQLGSPQGGGKVGMFIPGQRGSGELVSALVGLSNGASRTNVGIYNPNSSSVTAVVKVYQGVVELGRVTQSVGANQTVQFNVYQAVNQGGHVTTTGHVVVEASDEVFTYAAQADNTTNDTILIVGEADVAEPPGFVFPTPTITPTPSGPTLTPTPTPTQPSGAVEVLIWVRAWDFSPGGPVSPPLTLQVGTTYRLVFRNADSPGTTSPVHGFSGISDLGLPATETIAPGIDFVIAAFTPEPFHRGAYPFVCTQGSCGGDPEQHAHMAGVLIVQ
jgi:hypothetical protein